MPQISQLQTSTPTPTQTPTPAPTLMPKPTHQLPYHCLPQLQQNTCYIHVNPNTYSDATITPIHLQSNTSKLQRPHRLQLQLQHQRLPPLQHQPHDHVNSNSFSSASSNTNACPNSNTNVNSTQAHTQPLHLQQDQSLLQHRIQHQRLPRLQTNTRCTYANLNTYHNAIICTNTKPSPTLTSASKAFPTPAPTQIQASTPTTISSATITPAQIRHQQLLPLQH